MLRQKGRRIADGAKQLTLNEISRMRQIDAAEIGPHEPRSGEVRLVEVGVAQIGVREIGPVETGIGEVDVR